MTVHCAIPFDAPRGPSAVTFGTFDGMHLGHAAMMQRLVALANDRHIDPVVMTFDPHPLALLRPAHAPCALDSLDRRVAAMEAIGVRDIVVAPFDLGLSRLEPETFVEAVLVRALGAKVVLVGAGARFGHGARGDEQLLRHAAARLGFEVECMQPIASDGVRVSSTNVRTALSEGDVERAAGLLGRPFSIAGVVSSGRKLGRTIGVPTANVIPASGRCVPKHGVYITNVQVSDGPFLGAVTNVGVRPTVESQGICIIESHVLEGAPGDLDAWYDKSITVRFISRLRDEARFGTLEALVAQITIDIAQARLRLRLPWL